MKLIDKNKVTAEIDERLHKYEQEYEELARYEIWGTARKIRPKIEELKNFRSFINTIETKDVNLEKFIQSYLDDNFTSAGEPDEFLTTVMQRDDMVAFAKHFFELGINAQKGE